MTALELGESFVGSGPDAAHVNTVLGPRSGPAGTAWATALATPSAGHVPFVAVVRPGLPAKPMTLFVNKAAIASDSHARLTWGAAQAGVAGGVADAVADGVIGRDEVDELALIAAVWVDPAASDAEAVYRNNRAATRAALENGRRSRPPLDEVLAARLAPENPFFRPRGIESSSGGTAMKVRRVVTGHDRSGKAIFASDTEVEPITAALLPGSEFHKLWGGDRAPSFPDDGRPQAQPTYFPPVGGFRFGMFSLPPASSAAGPLPADTAAAARELDEKLPGLASYMEADAPGMHTTSTIDFEVVLDGEVWLELDDGKEVHLRAGDTVVQNGTRHAWHNRGTKPARLAVFIVGANHAKVQHR